MSVPSSITGRLMETWAHGQDIADTVGVVRAPSARLRSVADLGVRTFAFCFRQRGLPVPAEPVLVELTGPGAQTWTWGPPEAANRVEGDLLDFCLVVTQRRNVADTALRVTGPVAAAWISIAQAFAGGPTTPAPAVRLMQRGRCGSPTRPAFYGDRPRAMREIIDGGPVDVVTGDYLAELTMLILWKARRKDPSAGYARTFLTQLEQVLGTALDRGTRIVVNAGGLNPSGLAERVGELAARLRPSPEGRLDRRRRPVRPDRRADCRRARPRAPRHRPAAARVRRGRR